METPIDLKRIREKLIQNNLPQSLIDNFKALHKVQEEELVKLSSLKRKKRDACEIKVKTTKRKALKINSNRHNSQPSAKRRRSTTKSKRSRVAFGSRILGSEARYETETVGRTYFDDEDKSNSENIRIGKKLRR